MKRAVCLVLGICGVSAALVGDKDGRLLQQVCDLSDLDANCPFSASENTAFEFSTVFPDADPVTITLTGLPSNGVVSSVTNPGTVIEVGTILGLGDFSFVPNQDFFNANAVGGSLDGVGERICPGNELVCPETLSFNVTANVGGEESVTSFTIDFFVLSVDTDVTELTVNAEDGIVFGDQGDIEVDGIITIDPKNDGDLHLITLTLKSDSDDLCVTVPSLAAEADVNIVNEDENECDARSDVCCLKELSLQGFPSQIASVLTSFFVDAEEGNRTLTFSVDDAAGEVEDVSVLFVVEGPGEGSLVGIILWSVFVVGGMIIGVPFLRKRNKQLQMREQTLANQTLRATLELAEKREGKAAMLDDEEEEELPPQKGEASV